MNEALLGAIAATCFAVGVFFLRYWLSSRDRFFLYFAVSFWLEAGSRGAMAILRSWSDDNPVQYLLRLLAYVLILVAIWEKNRSR